MVERKVASPLAMRAQIVGVWSAAHLILVAGLYGSLCQLLE